MPGCSSGRIKRPVRVIKLELDKFRSPHHDPWLRSISGKRAQRKVFSLNATWCDRLTVHLTNWSQGAGHHHFIIFSHFSVNFPILRRISTARDGNGLRLDPCVLTKIAVCSWSDWPGLSRFEIKKLSPPLRLATDWSLHWLGFVPLCSSYFYKLHRQLWNPSP